MIKPFLAQSAVRRALLKHVRSDSYEASHVRKIAKALGLTLSAIQREAQILLEAGLLTSRQDGNRVLLEANPRHKQHKEVPRILAELEAEEAARGRSENVDEDRKPRNEGRGRPRGEHLEDLRTKLVQSEKKAAKYAHDVEELAGHVLAEAELIKQLSAALDASKVREADLAERLRAAESQAAKNEKDHAAALFRLEKERDLALEQAAKARELEAAQAGREKQWSAYSQGLAGDKANLEVRLQSAKAKIEKLEAALEKAKHAPPADPGKDELRIIGCAQCSAKFGVHRGSSGKRVKCPQCGAAQSVPDFAGP